MFAYVESVQPTLSIDRSTRLFRTKVPVFAVTGLHWMHPTRYTGDNSTRLLAGLKNRRKFKDHQPTVSKGSFEMEAAFCSSHFLLSEAQGRSGELL